MGGGGESRTQSPVNLQLVIQKERMRALSLHSASSSRRPSVSSSIAVGAAGLQHEAISSVRAQQRFKSSRGASHHSMSSAIDQMLAEDDATAQVGTPSAGRPPSPPVSPRSLGLPSGMTRGASLRVQVQLPPPRADSSVAAAAVAMATGTPTASSRSHHHHALTFPSSQTLSVVMPGVAGGGGAASSLGRQRSFKGLSATPLAVHSTSDAAATTAASTANTAVGGSVSPSRAAASPSLAAPAALPVSQRSPPPIIASVPDPSTAATPRVNLSVVTRKSGGSSVEAPIVVAAGAKDGGGDHAADMAAAVSGAESGRALRPWLHVEPLPGRAAAIEQAASKSWIYYVDGCLFFICVSFARVCLHFALRLEF
jgi:hypothetical protein